jgi:hypothetical protein
MDIQIRKFDPKVIDPCRTVVFIAKRGSGKTELMTDILYHQRKIPMGVVMSGTEESNEHYQKHVPDSFIYGKFEPDVVKKVIDHQKKVVRKMTEKEKENFSDPSKSVFILMDDCMYDKKWTRLEDMRCIFMNGRHYRIFFALTVQYIMDLPPHLRSQIDYVFVLKDNIIENKQKIWKHLFGVFPTFDVFNEVFTQCTEDYGCLVLNNRTTSNKIEDVVFWYKAKPNRKFKIGSSQLWDHHRRNYNPKYDSEEQQESKLHKKKNTLSVNVVKTDESGKKKKKN